MNLRLVVKDINQDVWYSKFENHNIQELEDLEHFLEKIGNMDYLSILTEEGNKVFLKGDHIVSALIEYSKE